LATNDLAMADVWPLLTQLRDDLLTGEYCPGPSRLVRIPKGPGRGHRVLRLANVEDRIVQRAVLQMVQPLLDPFFDARSFGGRPRRGPWQALATADLLVRWEGRSTWLLADLRDAFENVPLQRLLDVVQSRLRNRAMLDLLKRLLITNRKRGIAQGAATSPLWLNTYLDHFLDRPWRSAGGDPLIRYIDDLLVLRRPGEPADDAYAFEQLRDRLVSAGMPVKEDAKRARFDLTSGDRPTWLGFSVRLHQGRLAFQLPEEPSQANWEHQLRDALAECHLHPGAPQRARQAVAGFLHYLGPAYAHSDRRSVYRRIVQAAAELDFTELPPFVDAERQWKRSEQNWQRCRQRVAKDWAAAETSAGATPTISEEVATAGFRLLRSREQHLVRMSALSWGASQGLLRKDKCDA
jgi:hypothetical protein